MEHDPIFGGLFLFFSGQHGLLEIADKDGNGFCLRQKKLEQDKFPRPESEDAARGI